MTKQNAPASGGHRSEGNDQTPNTHEEGTIMTNDTATRPHAQEEIAEHRAQLAAHNQARRLYGERHRADLHSVKPSWAASVSVESAPQQGVVDVLYALDTKMASLSATVEHGPAGFAYLEDLERPSLSIYWESRGSQDIATTLSEIRALIADLSQIADVLEAAV